MLRFMVNPLAGPVLLFCAVATMVATETLSHGTHENEIENTTAATCTFA